MSEDQKTRLVAEAIRSAVGDDVHQLSNSLNAIAREVNSATSKLAQHEHAMKMAVRVTQWVGTPLVALFCWVLIRGQASIDDALRSQHATSLKIETILQQMEADRKFAEERNRALMSRVERIEQQRR